MWSLPLPTIPAATIRGIRMSDEDQGGGDAPAVNIGHAESVTVEPSSDQPAPTDPPADAPTQETPETPPEPSFTASPEDFPETSSDD